MLENIFYAAVIVVVTTFVGLAVTSKKSVGITKLVLAYVIGFTILSLTGLLATFLGIDVFMIQASALIVLIGLCVKRNQGFERIDNVEYRVLVVSIAYVIVFLFLLSGIPTWMAGDTMQRAIEIRMFLDGKDIPVSVFPFGSYWAQYPKAFQVYAFFWIKVLGLQVTEALKIIPVLLSLYAPLGLYCIVRELNDTGDGLYALVIACFGFIPHTAFLVWGGFTTLAGEMLLVSVILAYIVRKKLLPLLLIGLLFAHPRSFFFAVLVLGVWIAVEETRKKKALGIGVIGALVVLVIIVGSLTHGINFSVGQKNMIENAIKEKTLNSTYSLTWILASLGAVGLIYALLRRSQVDLLAISWIVSLTALALLVEFGVLSRHRLLTDRTLTELYLPLSMLAGSVFYQLEKKLRCNIVQIKSIMRILVVVGGILTSTVFIKGYYDSWGLPEQDYQALEWLSEKGYDNSILVSLDSTGMWAYPIADVELFEPFLFERKPPVYIRNIADAPNSDASLNWLDALSREHEHVLIYVSSVSTSRPYYKPPFARFYGFYLNPKTSEFSNEHYGTVYGKEGVFIFEYVRGGESR